MTLASGRLRWSFTDQWRRVDPPTDLLDRVLRLIDADDEAVADFARSYGVILLCAEHGLPLSHSRIIGHQVETESYRCPAEDRFVRIETYRNLAREVRAILNIAARLQNAADVDPQDWAELGYSETPRHDVISDTWEVGAPDREERTMQQREELGEFIDVWLDQCGFRARFEWCKDLEPSFQIVASGLVGAVAVRTMLAVAKSNGLAICTACKAPYAPRQKPKSNRSNYCPSCSGPGRFRDAKRRERARKIASAGDG